MAQTEYYKPAVALCTCGRSNLPIHCKSCGSQSKYPRTKEGITIVVPPIRTDTGELLPEKNVLVKRYVCRYCGYPYFENDNCSAPFLEKKLIPSEAKANRALTVRIGNKTFNIEEITKKAEIDTKKMIARMRGEDYVDPDTPTKISTTEKWNLIRASKATLEDFEESTEQPTTQTVKELPPPPECANIPDPEDDILVDHSAELAEMAKGGIDEQEKLLTSDEQVEMDKFLKGD